MRHKEEEPCRLPRWRRYLRTSNVRFASPSPTARVSGFEGSSERLYYAPKVLVDVPRGSPAYDDEIFGPVAALFRVTAIYEAIAFAKATRYGLASSAWTEDADEAERFANELDAGLTFVNSIVASDPRLPLGGVTESGYGRELSREYPRARERQRDLRQALRARASTNRDVTHARTAGDEPSWVVRLLVRLLKRAPEVVALFEKCPFSQRRHTAFGPSSIAWWIARRGGAPATDGSGAGSGCTCSPSSCRTQRAPDGASPDPLSDETSMAGRAVPRTTRRLREARAPLCRLDRASRRHSRRVASSSRQQTHRGHRRVERRGVRLSASRVQALRSRGMSRRAGPGSSALRPCGCIVQPTYQVVAPNRHVPRGRQFTSSSRIEVRAIRS
jgi:hypothetical protein